MSFLNRFRKRSESVGSPLSSSPKQSPSPDAFSRSEATVHPSTVSSTHREPQPCPACLALNDELTTLRGKLSQLQSDDQRRQQEELTQSSDQLQQRLQQQQHRTHELEVEALQLQATITQLMDDLGGRDRAMKRNESMAKETLRAKERQVVQQSTQLSEVQGKLLVLQDLVQERDAQLLRQQQRLATFEGRAVDGQEEQTAYQLQTQRIMKQREEQISALQATVAELRAKLDDVQRKQNSSEERIIRLDYDVQTRDATIASLKDTLDGARRIALLRGGAGGLGVETSDGSPTGNGEEGHQAVLNRQLSRSNDDFDSATEGNVAIPSSASGDEASRRVRDALGLESMLRAKDKQVIRLSNEVVALRADVSSKLLIIEQHKQDLAMSKATHASAVSAMEEYKMRADELSHELTKKSQQVTDLRTQKNAREEELTTLREQYAALLREADELRAQESAFRSFRVQHVDCQARIVDKDLALFQNSTALSECRSLLDRAYAENEQLSQQLENVKTKCATTSDESSVTVARSVARISSLEVQLAERKRCIHELEDTLANKVGMYEQLSGEMTSLRALREEEHEAWRNKTQQSQDALQQLQQSMHRTADQHQTREKQLLEQIEKLQAENNHILQSKREQEAHVLHLSEQLRREQTQKISPAVGGGGGGGVSERSRAPAGGSSSLVDEQQQQWDPRRTESNSTAFKPPTGLDEQSDNASDTFPQRSDGGAAAPTTRTSVASILSPTTRSAPAGQPSAGGGNSATTSLQRVSLELEETRQKFNRLQRDYASREREIENLMRRLQEAEAGSGGDGTTSCASERRRIAGIFESLSVELCHQLASHLRFDYMRNGTSLTMPAVMNSFHLGKEEAAEMMEALSRTMLMVRLHVHLPQICLRLGVKESSIRRVVHAFAKCGVQAPEDEGSRRRRLIATTPADARYTYSGSERLAFLFCAARRPKAYKKGAPFVLPPKSSSSSSVDVDECGEVDEEEDEKPQESSHQQQAGAHVRRLGQDRYLLGLVCSFLPVVLRGSTAFAAHVMQHPNSGYASGQTLLVSLEPARSTFTLMECEVSAGRTMAVLLSGTYRSGFSWQTCAHVKVSLTCRTKQDGVWVPHEDGTTTTAGKWEWSSVAKLTREESAEAVQYTIKRGDGMHDGLVAETKGVRLRELSVEEVMLIQELYSGELSSEEMMHHVSWDRIPSPTSGRKKSSSTTSAVKK